MDLLNNNNRITTHKYIIFMLIYLCLVINRIAYIDPPRNLQPGKKLHNLHIKFIHKLRCIRYLALCSMESWFACASVYYLLSESPSIIQTGYIIIRIYIYILAISAL